jgi:hypothetical protein
LVFIIKNLTSQTTSTVLKAKEFCTTEEKERRAPTAALHRGKDKN